MKIRSLVITAAVFAALGMIVGMIYHGMMLSFGRAGGYMAATHPMTFVLGCGAFLIAAILEKLFKLSDSKLSVPTYVVYVVGVVFTVLMLIIRGYVQVSGAVISDGADAAISGAAGIAHTVIAVGMVMYFVMLIRRIVRSEKGEKPTGDSAEKKD